MRSGRPRHAWTMPGPRLDTPGHAWTRLDTPVSPPAGRIETSLQPVLQQKVSIALQSHGEMTAMTASRLHYPPEEFTVRLRQRIPMNVCFTFSSEQLEALRRVFGDRFDGEHDLDLRGRLHLPWSRYYIVLQAGRDRRQDLRRSVASSGKRTAIDSVLCALSITGVAAGIVWLAMTVPW